MQNQYFGAKCNISICEQYSIDIFRKNKFALLE